MREILFRGKAINRDSGFHRTNYKNGDWVYGLVTRLYDERFENLPAEMTDINCTSGIEIDYKTIGQYTGLIDKNGKKIFEGDLCLCNRNINDRFDKTVFVIKYDELIGFYGENEWGGNTISADEFDMCEIVGNIHDNKLEDF